MIMHRSDQALAISALRSAAPYIRMYKGKTFVVKAGGGVFADIESTRVLIEQIAILHYFGVRVVFVHGGGRCGLRWVYNMGSARPKRPSKIDTSRALAQSVT